MTVGAVLLLVLLVLVLSGGEENSLYAAAAGVAFYGMLLLLCLTAVAIIVYFRRNKSSMSFWRTLISPIVALVGIGFALLTASFNMELLVAGDPLLLTVLLLIPYVSIAVGVFVALALRSRRPDTYVRIGRALD